MYYRNLDQERQDGQDRKDEKFEEFKDYMKDRPHHDYGHMYYNPWMMYYYPMTYQYPSMYQYPMMYNYPMMHYGHMYRDDNSSEGFANDNADDYRLPRPYYHHGYYNRPYYHHGYYHRPYYHHRPYYPFYPFYPYPVPYFEDYDEY